MPFIVIDSVVFSIHTKRVKKRIKKEYLMPAVFLNIANFGGSNRVFFYCFDEQKKSENKHDYIRYLSSQVSSRGIPVLC